MSNNLRTLADPFQFDHFDVRTAIDENDNVWFCAKDVCEVLDIVWKGVSATLENMEKNWFMVLKLQTIKGERDSIFINEAGLYSLIFRSNKPKAKEFANWVLEVVLPELRRNGFFGEFNPKDRLAYSKQILEIATRMKTEKDGLVFLMLHDEFKELCRLIGRPVPDLTLLGTDYKQLDLFLEQIS